MINTATTRRRPGNQSAISIRGIILRKSLIKEHHLLVTFLTEHNEKLSLLMLGGQGGRKKIRSQILELGNVVQITLTESSRKLSEGSMSLKQCREWSLVWQHQNLRYHYGSYQLLINWLQQIERVSTEHGGGGELSQGHESAQLYSHLGNALTVLDQYAKQGDSKSLPFLELYFSLRLYCLLGVAPRTDGCLGCQSSLHEGGRQRHFQMASGGFYCENCQHERSNSSLNFDQSEIWNAWRWAKGTNWKSLGEFESQVRPSSGLWDSVKSYGQYHMTI